MQPFMIKKFISILTLAFVIIYPTQEQASRHNSCTLLATPDDNIIDKIAEDIDAVGQHGYIGVETPALLNGTIISRLIDAVRKGIHVQVFVDRPEKIESPNRDSASSRLKNNNVNVTIMPGLHAKRVVISKNMLAPTQDQDNIVYIGSLNITANSPQNHEIMIRCTDPVIFKQSFNHQNRYLRLGSPFFHIQALPVNFTSRRLIHSSSAEAAIAKKKFLEHYQQCDHPGDYLYVAAYTLDDPAIIHELIQIKLRSHKPIKVILDGDSWHHHRTTIDQLVQGNIDVYIFNKNRIIPAASDYRKLMHIKAMVGQCGQEHLALVSTANFTVASNHQINYDLWEPGTPEFAAKLKRILDIIIRESEQVKPCDVIAPPAGTPQERGRKILELMWYGSSIRANTTEIMCLIESGADVTLRDALGRTALMRAAGNGNLKITQALLDKGADIDARDSQGKTAIDYAEEERIRLAAHTPGVREQVKLLKLLKEAKFDRDITRMLEIPH